MSIDDRSVSGSPTIVALGRALTDQPGSTVAALALAAGIGRSTAGKLLAQMERAGTARRDPGGHDGTRRLADHWYPAAAPASAPSSPSADVPPEVTVATGTPPAASGRGADSTSSSPRASTIDASASLTPRSPAQLPPPVPAKPAAFTGPCPTCGHVRRPSARATPGGRLGQGQLYELVLRHLTDNAGQEWTATGLAKAIGKSSGAISNALAAMAGRGEAEMTCAAPRRYRAAQASGRAVQAD